MVALDGVFDGKQVHSSISSSLLTTVCVITDTKPLCAFPLNLIESIERKGFVM